MQRKRHIILILLCICLVFSVFAGCNQQQEEKSEEAVTSHEKTPMPTRPQITPKATATPEVKLSQAELEQLAYDEFIADEISRRQVFEFVSITPQAETSHMFDVFEIAFDITADYQDGDQYAEAVCNINAYIETPNGDVEKMPAFYKKHDGLRWAVRYNPRTTGIHTFYLKDEIEGTQSDKLTFDVLAANENRGFITVLGNKLVDSYDRQFTILGTNFAWGRVEEYQKALPLYQEHSMNFIRFWSQCDWSAFNLESKEGEVFEGGEQCEYFGLGDYSLENAARMDWLMELFEDHGVYMQLCLFNLWDFDSGHWEKNAYNEANGGPCTWSSNKTDFWTDPVAIKYQKQLIRYIYSRYGSNRALGVFEYWNECDNKVKAKNRKIRDAWHKTMDDYFKSLDIYDHPTTTSYAWTDHPEFNDEKTAAEPWKSQEFLDIADPHNYIKKEVDPVPLWIEQFDFTGKHFVGDKPLYMGEYSEQFIELNDNSPATERYFAEGIWAPIFFSDTAGSNLYWRVDTKFLPSEAMLDYMLYAAQFIKPFEDKLHTMEHVYAGIEGDFLRIGYYHDKDTLLMLIRDDATPYTKEKPRTVEEAAYSIPDMGNGSYAVTYYDPFTGKVVKEDVVKCSDTTLKLSVPAFKRYVAVSAVKK